MLRTIGKGSIITLGASVITPIGERVDPDEPQPIERSGIVTVPDASHEELVAAGKIIGSDAESLPSCFRQGWPIRTVTSSLAQIGDSIFRWPGISTALSDPRLDTEPPRWDR